MDDDGNIYITNLTLKQLKPISDTILNNKRAFKKKAI
ncbi:hypothetical protein BH18THE2_BH18THE2_17850 [soil metagenome]